MICWNYSEEVDNFRLILVFMAQSHTVLSGNASVWTTRIHLVLQHTAICSTSYMQHPVASIAVQMSGARIVCKDLEDVANVLIQTTEFTM